ncbi:hypothetical protein AVEN_261556-1 [Araneus ventricosus]|uniref:Uncharacterized protein n=1 Tax=Araneus ventricosus TaxID=182803 RepID=A0A4Y2JVI0_ARAVE|nr:hypothetical protein AVEN_261556-1 [Araneus ventricosus]
MSESRSLTGFEMLSKRVSVKRRKEKEQKQQHVSLTEIILMTSFTLVKSYMLQKVFLISTRSSHSGFTAASHGIPNDLEDSWHSRISPEATEMRATTSSTESTRVSYHNFFI